MKKLFLPVLCVAITMFATALPVRADGLASFENIDSLIEDNSLTEIANRYNALLLSYRPEQASHLGYMSANGLLNQRTPATEASITAALKTIKETLDEINVKKLSPSKRADYDILKGRLENDLRFLQTNPSKTNPLYHAQALDAVYELQLKQISDPGNQNKALLSRIRALSTAAQNAQNYLTQPTGMLAQLAMEKAYYAYLAFDEMSTALQQTATDNISLTQMMADSKEAKKNIGEMFELFKQQAKENDKADFRLGKTAYAQQLQDIYFISSKKLESTLQKNYKEALANLQQALAPFFLPAKEAELAAKAKKASPKAAVKKMSKKQRKAFIASLSARDFYKVAEQIENTVLTEKNLRYYIANETVALAQLLTQKGALPHMAPRVTIRELPTYYAKKYSNLFVAPFGLQANPAYDFYVRMPAGDYMEIRDQLNKDFNDPTRKLILAGELIPGRYVQTSLAGVYASPRALLPVPTLPNGWNVYAQHLAEEVGYINTNEERLYLAWADYVRAAAALADYGMHNKLFSYPQAMAFLTQKAGLESTLAESILKESVAQPGEAVSYIMGYKAITAARKKYRNKMGKKFSLADFHSKLLKIGAIPPTRLEEELKAAYTTEKKKEKSAEDYLFFSI